MSLSLQNEDVHISESNVTVSVIIATYRRDTSLKRAIASLINQTYKGAEIIVVDDNADDIWNRKVKKIIDEMNVLHPITYIKNEVNKGSAETRNIGIKASTGEYVTFLDDDDIYLKDKIKNQVEHMIDKISDFCITDLDLYDENEKLVEKRNRRYIKEFNKETLLMNHLMHHITGTDTLMFRKDYLLNIGGFPPFNVGDEFYLVQKAIEAGGVFSYLPICDVKAYIHSKTEGLSHGDRKILGENNLYQYKMKYFDEIPNKSVQYIKMRHYMVLAYAQYRMKQYFMMAEYLLFSFLNSPNQCMKLVINSFINKRRR